LEFWLDFLEYCSAAYVFMVLNEMFWKGLPEIAVCEIDKEVWFWKI